MGGVPAEYYALFAWQVSPWGDTETATNSLDCVIPSRIWGPSRTSYAELPTQCQNGSASIKDDVR